jgi:hypothetical protein
LSFKPKKKEQINTMSNTTTLIRHEGHLPEATSTDEHESLIDERDALLAHVRAQEAELEASLRHRVSQGQGFPSAMYQLLAAIRQGRGQIALIDIRLAALGLT